MDPTQRPAAGRLTAVRAAGGLLPARPRTTRARASLPAFTLPVFTLPVFTLRVFALVVFTVLTGSAAVLLGAAPARAGDVFVQVNPSTVEAGFLVGIKASCTDNTLPATVESPAFGTVTVQPQGGQLTAAAMVPAQTRAGSYRVRLDCPDGRNATTNLNVVTAKHPTRGPATGFGGGAGGDDLGGLLVGGGLAITALGAVLGVLAVRRRAALAGGATTRRRTRS